jgi:catechol 2,3-dioxygenase-like lactoylglutathione lyase family enzyme
MIGKGLFHTHPIVWDAAKSFKFYTGLFGMEQVDFKDGALVFLTTPGRGNLLVLNPGGELGYPGGCAKERPREEKLAGVPRKRYSFWVYVAKCGRIRTSHRIGREIRWTTGCACDHGGATSHTYIADPDGYVVEIQYGR